MGDGTTAHADRVTNICERVVFLATGEMAEMKTTSNHGLERDIRQD